MIKNKSILFSVGLMLGMTSINSMASSYKMTGNINVKNNVLIAKNSSQENLGLYDLQDFIITTGQCSDCGVSPQSLWYFKNEIIAVPKDKQRIAQDTLLPVQQDVKNFYQKNKNSDNSLPSVIWTASPHIVEGKLNGNATALITPDGKQIKFDIVPKIPTNLSYYNKDSIAYFANKEVIARGVLKNNNFVAKSIWLKDFNINKPLPVSANNTPIIDMVRKSDNNFGTQVLWSKNGKNIDVANKPVLAFVLNGAQGDDDEAHGGHFAVATGVFGKNGEWNNWLVNNFYGLNSFSEKGITASILPMDAYQADLNSGQSWYRPSYMLVAVLKDKKAAQIYQQSINRVFNHFYKHNFEYNHALNNCVGINMQTMRTLGWSIPKAGAENIPKAIAALPFVSITDKSLTNGKKAFDYLYAETTELYPLVGFDAVGNDLLQRIVKGQQPKNEFEATLMQDIEAVVYIKLPQFPSSRAIGSAPVASLDEYMARVPEDKADWKIVPVEPRVFPNELKGENAMMLIPSDYALAGYVLFFILIAYGVYVIIKKRKK